MKCVTNLYYVAAATASAEISRRVRGNAYCVIAPLKFSDQVFEAKMFDFVQERL